MANNRKLLTAVFLIAFTVRLITAVVYLNFDSHALTMHTPFLSFAEKSSNEVWRVVGERDGYNTLANDILTYGKIGKGYGRPPLYSIFLATGYFIFGFNLFGFFIPQITLASINSILILLLAQRMFNNKIGIIASLFYAFNPHFILISIQLYAETLYFFLLLSLFLSCQKLFSESTPKYAVLSVGIFMGLGALCREVFLIFVPFILIWLIIVFCQERRKMLVLLSTILISFLLVYGGWIKKEYKMFHHNFFCAHPRSGWETYSPSKVNEHDKYGDRYKNGEVSLVILAKENPKQYFWRSIKQLKSFLFEPCVKGVSLRHKIVSSFIFFTIYPLGYLGIVKAVREREKIALLALLFIGSINIFHILTFIDGELRYRLPVELFMTIFAAYAIVNISVFSVKKR